MVSETEISILRQQLQSSYSSVVVLQYSTQCQHWESPFVDFIEMLQHLVENIDNDTQFTVHRRIDIFACSAGAHLALFSLNNRLPDSFIPMLASLDVRLYLLYPCLGIPSVMADRFQQGLGIVGQSELIQQFCTLSNYLPRLDLTWLSLQQSCADPISDYRQLHSWLAQWFGSGRQCEVILRPDDCHGAAYLEKYGVVL
ncbi:hypothetical protein BTA51_28150 [Hahella sp. CCB-MM4]|nr:hypothetical protein BTA51_28150 [Hahella sp. CCB-MM4]